MPEPDVPARRDRHRIDEEARLRGGIPNFAVESALAAHAVAVWGVPPCETEQRSGENSRRARGSLLHGARRRWAERS